MTKSPMLWGAGLACALGGAVAGTALGSTPILDRPVFGSFYQSHNDTATAAQAERQLPDHYPLVTREGTVPVAQLAERGLYSQSRYRAYVYADYTPPEVQLDEYRPGEEWRDEATREAYAMADRATSPGPSGEPETKASEPLQLAAGPANVEGHGDAKLVDVNAALAMR